MLVGNAQMYSYIFHEWGASTCNPIASYYHRIQDDPPVIKILQWKIFRHMSTPQTTAQSLSSLAQV